MRPSTITPLSAYLSGEAASTSWFSTSSWPRKPSLQNMCWNMLKYLLVHDREGHQHPQGPL